MAVVVVVVVVGGFSVMVMGMVWVTKRFHWLWRLVARDWLWRMLSLLLVVARDGFCALRLRGVVFSDCVVGGGGGGRAGRHEGCAVIFLQLLVCVDR